MQLNLDQQKFVKNFISGELARLDELGVRVPDSDDAHTEAYRFQWNGEATRQHRDLLVQTMDGEIKLDEEAVETGYYKSLKAAYTAVIVGDMNLGAGAAAMADMVYASSKLHVTTLDTRDNILRLVSYLDLLFVID